MKRGRKDKGALEWLEEMAWPNALMSAAVAIMHPDMYRAGRDTLIKLGKQEHAKNDPDGMADVLAKWGAVFNGVNVISNRQTPLHRDNYSSAEWYDLLATVGDYANGVLELPTVGVRLKYPPGTLVALSGRVLRHGASEVDGDRLCLAWYMRSSVHRRMDVSPSTWRRY